MAQQTINIGASPNDGTGTPLRTAFQYTNSNFSELYTAVGPSGNNIVVPGNATITGDLTVDTSTLKVDSANDRVGIGTASPVTTFQVQDAVLTGAGQIRELLIKSNSNTVNNSLNSLIGVTFNSSALAYTAGSLERTSGVYGINLDNAAFGRRMGLVFYTSEQDLVATEKYRIDNSGIATWSNVGGVANTAMTLNATGLGVGGSPVEKLTIAGRGLFVTANPDNAAIKLEASTGTNAVAINFRNTGGNYFVGVDNSAGGRLFGVPYSLCVGSEGAYPVVIATNNTARLTVDTAGQVGIGVTPSAWRNTQRALQIGAVGAYFSSAASTGSTAIGRNVYENSAGDFTYIVNDEATFYEQTATGVHAWYSAAAGTGTISFGDAKMTLDASGRLLVGTANASVTSETGCRLLLNNGATGHFTVAVTTNQSTAATSCYDFYSTSAAAYRFYVTSAGVINATNTTISAISDARLKENVQDIDVGLGAILALKPRKFDWKAGKGKDIKGDRGFIAQEFEQVFPQLVDEWKDAAPEGEAPYKSVRQDLIPVLVKAIQELTARVQTLETR